MVAHLKLAIVFDLGINVINSGGIWKRFQVSGQLNSAINGKSS